MLKNRKLLIGCLPLLFATIVDAAPVFTPGVEVDNPRYTNDFEGIADDYLFAAPSYTQNNISVKQSGNDVRTIDNNLLLGMQGVRAWYGGDYINGPSYSSFIGGNNGYTRITLANDLAFFGLSLLVGDGRWEDGSSLFYLNYILLNTGKVVLQGNHTFNDQVLPVSFLGGGFDEIWLSSTVANNKSPNDGIYQELVIDNIKATAVPLPATVWLLVSGLMGLLGGMKLKRN